MKVLMMSSQYTASISVDDAIAMAKLVDVDYSLIPIKSLFESFKQALSAEFKGREEDATEENLQARIRGMLLMALSNKYGSIVLTTGNKSETAVGYTTLYGDMAGGFALLKDVPKTWFIDWRTIAIAFQPLFQNVLSRDHPVRNCGTIKLTKTAYHLTKYSTLLCKLMWKTT